MSLKKLIAKLFGKKEEEKVNPSLSTFYQESSYFQSTATNIREVVSNQGKLGELMVCNTIDKLQIPKKIAVNVYLPKKDDKYTEIDLVLITQKGVYVIENKNHSGAIYGNLKYKDWLEYYGGTKIKFYSPVFQNDAHVKALLSHVPNLKEERVFSLIVFSNRCEFHIADFEKKNTYIIHRQEILQTIQNIEDSLSNHFKTNDMNKIHEILDSFARQPEEIKQSHIQSIKEKATLCE